MIRQLENSIEKMLMKVRTGQKVTLLYLAVKDVLKKVGCPSLSQHAALRWTCPVAGLCLGPSAEVDLARDPER